MTKIPRTEAASELLRRRVARRSLLAFTQYTYPQYVAEPVHDLIAQTLDAVVGGHCKRLMIFAPPQMGKSELTSVRLPAYWLGRRPDDPIILTSYGADLAYSKSRQARAIVESAEYQRLFSGVTVQQDSRSVQNWQIAGRKGELLAAGVGGPITGHGALLGIIDDPFENWEQAQSQTYRNRVWEWYKGTFRTRIWENGALVLIMTRWHEDDLAGRLLREGGWQVLRLPAIAETQDERDDNARRAGLPQGEADPLGRAAGEPVSPRRFSLPALLEIKRDVGHIVWGAEYQGAPRAAEGNRIKRDWLPVARNAPTFDRLVRYWDKAGSEGAGKFTAGVLMGIANADDPNLKQFWILHVVRGQWTAGAREQIILSTAQADAETWGRVEIWHEQEPGSGGKESAEATTSNLAGFIVNADKVTGDKDVRLEPFAAQAEAGRVRILSGPWNNAYIDELTAVPNGVYRDQADATAGTFNKLAATRRQAWMG